MKYPNKLILREGSLAASSMTVDAYPDDGSTGKFCIMLSGSMNGNGLGLSVRDARRLALALLEAAEFAEIEG